MKKIALFLNIEKSKQDFEKIANAISANEMSKREDTTGKAWRSLPGYWKDNEPFIRRGKVGSWTEYFNQYPKLSEEFDRWAKRNFPQELVYCDHLL